MQKKDAYLAIMLKMEQKNINSCCLENCLPGEKSDPEIVTLLMKNKLRQVYSVYDKKDSVYTMYFEFEVMRSYIYVISDSGNKKLSLHSYCKSRLTPIMERWYYWERARFGCVQ